MMKQLAREQAKKFVREVGSVVLGVLIALGIGEIADDVRWRLKVRDSETAMRGELGLIRRILNERMAAGPCILARIDALGQRLRAPGAGAPITNFANPPYRLIERTAFEVARDEGVSLHMPPHRWRMYAAAYALTTDLYGGFSEPERTRWDLLRLLERPGSIDPDLRAQLTVAWAEAKAYAHRQQGLARQGDRLIGGLGIPIDWAFDTAPGGPHSLAEQKATVARLPICRPIAEA
jgi:hypothetical protein